MSISIHAPRGGSDFRGFFVLFGKMYFNPRSPWGERREKAGFRSLHRFYFNPRSPWGERRLTLEQFNERTKISIHAPRGGSDYYDVYAGITTTPFQSTLPVGGATNPS